MTIRETRLFKLMIASAMAFALMFILSGCTLTQMLAGAALLQGRTAVQVNAGDFKAGIAVTLPKTVQVPVMAAPVSVDD